MSPKHQVSFLISALDLWYIIDIYYLSLNVTSFHIRLFLFGFELFRLEAERSQEKIARCRGRTWRKKQDERWWKPRSWNWRLKLCKICLALRCLDNLDVSVILKHCGHVFVVPRLWKKKMVVLLSKVSFDNQLDQETASDFQDSH